MLETREHSDLANESKLAGLGAGVGVEDFDRDLSFVLEVSGEVNGSECPLAYLALNFVTAAKRLAQWRDRVKRRTHGSCIRCKVTLGRLGRLEHSTRSGNFANIGAATYCGQRFLVT